MEELDIPILRKAYDLYRTFHGLRSVVPKADRYTLWQRSENLILDLLEGILLASQLPRAEKLPYLEKVSVKLNVLRLFLRLTKDAKALELKKVILLQEIVDEIGRMLGGWIKSTKESNHKLSPSPSALTREKEVPRGDEQGRREPDVVIAVAIPVVVDVHAAIVDREFGAVVVGEPSIAHSRPRAPGVESYRSFREPMHSSPCISFGSNSAFGAKYLR